MEVFMKVKSIAPDRTNYKKYGTMYEPEELVLVVDLPESEVKEDGTQTIITEKGMELLLAKLANIPDNVEDNYLHNKLPK